MKSVLSAAVIAALMVMPVQAVVPHTYSCVVSEEFGGETIWLVSAGSDPVFSYTRYSEPNAEQPDDARSVEVVTMNDTAVIYDPETRALLMLFDGDRAFFPHESGTWFEADCSLGGVPASILRDLGIEDE